MRRTLLVVGLVVVGTVVAWLRFGPSDAPASPAPALSAAAPSAAPGAPAVARGAQAPVPVAAGPLEDRAQQILREVAAAHDAKDRARYDRAVEALQAEAWDAPSARRFAVKLGFGTLEEAERRQGLERVQLLDRARRLLSRGTFLDEGFAADGSDTAERSKLLAAIQKGNQEVMTWCRRASGGLEGVTRAYEVPPGWAPVVIVSREKLPYGHNAILYWNHAGNLDPRRLRAGEILLLPTETLSVQVHLARFRLALFLGDWFVKEFRVGAGRPESPTPTGTFQVGPKMENPDWWSPTKGHIPPLREDNELGTAWIPFFGETLPIGAGFGLHGTNRPETVGTRCSNGCVRLANEEASELFWWVRTGSGGSPADSSGSPAGSSGPASGSGLATPVVIR